MTRAQAHEILSLWKAGGKHYPQKPSMKPSQPPATLRQNLIDHILFMKTFDSDYAREALRFYNELLPDFELNAGIRDAMKAQQ